VVDVFEQVEEELRSDRYQRLAKTWLPLVGGVLGVALLAALAWWGWDSWQSRQADQASAAYDRGMEALEAGNLRGADREFLDAQDKGNAAYKALALAQRGAIAVEENRLPQAVELFDQSARAARDPLLADAQALKAALLVIDTGSLEDVRGRLKPLMGENRPYRALAEEALAAKLLQHGQTKEARDLLGQLQIRPDVPENVRERARSSVAMIDAGALGGVGNLVGSMPLNPPAPQAQPAAAPGLASPQ